MAIVANIKSTGVLNVMTFAMLRAANRIGGQFAPDATARRAARLLCTPFAAGRVRAVGWDWAARCMDLQLCEGSLVDVAYRVRENDHPDFGGIEIEIAGVRISDE